MKHNTVFAIALSLGLSTAVAATGSQANLPRYRVAAVPSPAAADAGCLPGHTVRTVPRGINDHGSVAADYLCFKVAANGIPLAQFSQGFVWSPRFGAQLMPRAAEVRDVNAVSVNNRGEVFGREVTLQGAAYGVEWSLHGGYERIFVAPPECSNIDSAAAGSVFGYVVGYGLRPDAASGGCAVKWLIRTPVGEIREGPAGGQAWDINFWNFAVGDAGSAAVRVHAPSGNTQVLFAGDATTFGRAQDINDQGEVAGYLSLQNKFCGQATAASWDRSGQMMSLPHLAGQVSSRAHAIGADEVVGQSGPGQYCALPYGEAERAVLWKGRRTVDLNTLVPQWLNITLMRAVGVNGAGQIVALGFRDDEPLAGCPVLSWDENDNPVLDYSTPCRNLHIFVLTPVH
ncbi:MAG TPA: hypothetical protein VFO82_03230 [Steroidobacteraceae bacterium]|nr:hypothetical protein [Steroidobacteraceae bacterium]